MIEGDEYYPLHGEDHTPYDEEDHPYGEDTEDSECFYDEEEDVVIIDNRIYIGDDEITVYDEYGREVFFDERDVSYDKENDTLIISGGWTLEEWKREDPVTLNENNIESKPEDDDADPFMTDAVGIDATQVTNAYIAGWNDNRLLERTSNILGVVKMTIEDSYSIRWIPGTELRMWIDPDGRPLSIE